MNERCGVREKNFSEELPYFKERLNKVLDEHYDSNGGGEDPLHICVLRDSNRIVRKAEAEIERLQKIIVGFMDEVGTWSNKYDVDISNIHKLPLLAKEDWNIRNKIKSEAIKEFAKRLKRKEQWDTEFREKLVFVYDIDNLVKEMTEVNENG